MAATTTNGKTTQRHRLLGLTTPLGDDALLVESLLIQESISALFRIDLQLVAQGPLIGFERLAGQQATVQLQLPDGSLRLFHGHLSRFTQLGSNERFQVYAAEIVPWLWFLTQTTDCRVFQRLTVPQILKMIFEEHRFLDFRDATTPGRHTAWDYCVQYRETDFNFVSRLMEQEGIFYWFEHDQRQARHVLVFADSPQVHVPCPGQARAKYLPDQRREPGITSWQQTYEVRPGKYALRDYHFELPDRPLEVNRPSSITGPRNGQLEVFDYPGGFAKLFNEPQKRLEAVVPEGEQTSRLRMEEEETPHRILHGSSNCRTFTTGTRFELFNHPQASFNDSYVLTSVQHSATQDSGYVSGRGSVGAYSNSFTCIPLRTPFRPARHTPKPVVQGPQTAVVVGAPGKEIDVDRFGRVKVQFHWDRRGRNDQDSSCWIRVAQFWAGKRWGASFWPRLGQEVIVDFLDGDPDRPIIVGSVYNANQMPPYLGDGPDPRHPHDPNLSGIKTCSTPGGNGFNEIRFDDTKGKEQVFLHAERNLDVRVKADHMEWDGGSNHLIVGGDQCEQIGGDYHRTVGGDRNEKVSGTLSWSIGGDAQMKVGNNVAVDAGSEIHLKSGVNLVIESAYITLKAGGSFIHISSCGVDIVGPLVRINSGGSPGSGAGASPASPKGPAEADRAESGERAGPRNVSATPVGGAFADRASATRSAVSSSATVQVLLNAARAGRPTCEICAKLEQVQNLLT